jgi:hypothetical protein
MDDIIRHLRASGRPVTRETWLGLVFGELTNAELLALMPHEIAILLPGEEVGLQEAAIEAEKQYSTPSFARGLRANWERRKKLSTRM